MRLVVFAAAVAALPCTALAQVAEPSPPASEHLPGVTVTSSGEGDAVFTHQLRHARERIERGQDEGRLTRREAKALRREASRIDVFADRFGQDGLSDAERRELEVRTGAFEAEANLQTLGPRHR